MDLIPALGRISPAGTSLFCVGSSLFLLCTMTASSHAVIENCGESVVF